MPRNKVKDPNHLGLGHLLIWKSSDITSGWINSILLNFLSMYASDFLGINIGLIGVLLSAILAPIAASLIQMAISRTREFDADGIIYENVKFCDFWGFERALASHIQYEDYGHPVLTIDRPYNAKTSGQLRTRFQAFVESLEIKRIQQGKEVK